MIELAIALALIALITVPSVIVVRRETHLRETFEALAQEGRSVANIPSLEALLTQPKVRAEYGPKIVAVCYNAHGDTAQRGDAPYYEAQVYVIDDGGGIHVIDTELHNGSVKARQAFEGGVPQLRS